MQRQLSILTAAEEISWISMNSTISSLIFLLLDTMHMCYRHAAKKTMSTFTWFQHLTSNKKSSYLVSLVYVLYHHITTLDGWTDLGWAKKTGPFLSVDNFATVSGRKACYMSVVCKFCPEKKYKTCIAVCLNILCLICINTHSPWNYADNNAYFYEFSLDTQWNNNDRLHTWLLQSKFNMGTFDLDNHHQFFGSWSITRFNMSSLSWAQKSISSLARVSAGQCLLKFCDNTPSVATHTHWIIHRI